MHFKLKILTTIRTHQKVVLIKVVEKEVLELEELDSEKSVMAAKDLLAPVMEQEEPVVQDLEVAVALNMEAAVAEAVEYMVLEDLIDVDKIRTQDSISVAMINQ